MLKRIFLLTIFLPAAAFGQSFVGSYRAVFFDLFSGSKAIVVEFRVSTEMSLSGILKIDGSEKSFSGKVDKNGKFEAVIEQSGNYSYKVKGKFDRENKISLVQREQSGSGWNKSVSERAMEGQFSQVRLPLPRTDASAVTGPIAEPSPGGKSSLRITHPEALFGTDWTDLTAAASFRRSEGKPSGADPPKDTGSNGSPDLLIVNARSKVEGEQTLMISIPDYNQGRKIWRQNELRAASYREVKRERRNSFLTGASFQTDPSFADGKIEIVEENESQIVLRLTNFKIKRLSKEEFVTLDGFIYASK